MKKLVRIPLRTFQISLLFFGLAGTSMAVNPPYGTACGDEPCGCDCEEGGSDDYDNESVSISFGMGRAPFFERPSNFSLLFVASAANADDSKLPQGVKGNMRYFDSAPIENLWRASLRLKTPDITAESFKPSSLTYNHALDMEVYAPGGVVRQILTYDYLVDVQPLPAGQEGFEIKWYFADDKGSKSNDLYQPTEAAFKTVTISNPDPVGTYERLDSDSEKDMPGGTLRKLYYRYEFGSNSQSRIVHNLQTWSKKPELAGAVQLEDNTLEFISGAPVNGVEQYNQDRIRTIRRVDVDATGGYGSLSTVSRVREVYSDIDGLIAGKNGGKMRMTSRTVLSSPTDDAAGLTTTYGYYREDKTSDGVQVHGLPHWQKDPDGNWSIWQVTGGKSTQITKQIEPFENGTFVLADDGSNVASVVEAEAKVTTEIITGTSMETSVTVRGQLVSRTNESYRIGTLGERVMVRFDYDSASSSLASSTAHYPYGDGSLLEAGRLAWEFHRDGTATTYDYDDSNGNGEVEVTKSTGATSSSIRGNKRPDVTDGIKTATTYNRFWEPIAEKRSDIATGINLDYWVTMPSSNSNNEPVDMFGRWTSRVFNGNTDDYETRTFGCCGPTATRSRYGATTSTKYDLLKRVFERSTKQSSTDTPIVVTTDRSGLVTTRSQSAGPISFDTSVTTRNLLGETIERQTADADGNGAMEVTAIATSYPTSSGGRVVSVTGPLNTTRVTTSYRDGRTASVTGTSVADVAYSYDSHALNGGGLVTRMYRGDSTSSEWQETSTDLLGRPIRTAFPDGAYSTASYFPSSSSKGSIGKLASTQDADEVAISGSGSSVSYLYNGEGERTTTTETLPTDANGDAQERVTVTNRDVVATVDILINSETTTIAPAYRSQTKINGIEISASYRSEDGFLSGTTSLNGNSLSQRSAPDDTTDGNWTVTNITPDGQTSVQTYTDGQLAFSQLYDKATPSVLIASNSYLYDSLGRNQTVTDSRTGAVTYTSYTPSGNLLSMDDHGRITSYTYDALGRSVKVDAPDTNDGNGGTYANITHTAYYEDGQVKAQWGDQTYPRWYDYDGQNRMEYLHTYTSDPGLDPASLPTNAPAGNAQTTQWLYDSQRGWLTGKEDHENKGATYTYTNAGRLKTRTWERGVVTTYGYEQGLLDNITYSGESNGHQTSNLNYTYDNYGRIDLVTRGSATHADYDYNGTNLRLELEKLNQDTLGKTLTRNYDSLGRPKSVTSGSEYAASYGYDSSGRLQHVHPAATLPASPATSDFTYGYTPNSFGLIESITGPVHTVTNTYESTRNVLELKSNELTGGGVISGYHYNVNSIGQREGVAQSGSAFTGTPTVDWSYDSLGQVTAADHSINAADRGYAYDAIGNRKEIVEGTTTVTGTDNYLANALNQYTSVPAGSGSLAPVHDGDGNATSYPLPIDVAANATLTWDAENRLIKAVLADASVINYSYDYLGRRISRSIGTNPSTQTNYLYDGWNCVAEYTDSTLDRTYLWGLDLSGSMQGAGGVGGLLSQTEVANGSTTYYPTYDGNGNVSEYLTSTGSVSAHYEYDSFGNLLASSSDTLAAASYKFSTKPKDSATGLYYYGYRYYDPVTGRWPSRDPMYELGHELMIHSLEIEVSRGIPSVNDYQFVFNNAVRFIDFDGRGAGEALGAAAALALLDGPLPFGDIAATVIVIGVVANALDDEEEEDVDPLPVPIPDVAPGNTGDCTAQEHAILQIAVNSLCKGERACECPPVDCNGWAINIVKNKSCKNARDKINKRCFKGGDPGHKEAAGSAARALKNCLKLKAKHCM